MRPLNNFDVTEAIAKRHSVRTYDASRQISAETLQSLLAVASSVPNPFDTSGVCFGLTQKSDAAESKIGTYGIVKGASSYIGLGVSDCEISCLAGGYSLEAAVLYATTLGLGSVWLGGTLKRKSFYDAFGFTPPIALPAIIAIGYPAPKRLTEKAFRLIAKSDSRKPWERLFFDNDMNMPLPKEKAGIFQPALSNLRIAPSAMNGQPWRVVKQGDKLHFYVEMPSNASKLDRMLKHIHMGIAICHFNLTLMQEKIEGFFESHPQSISLPETYRYITTWAPK